MLWLQINICLITLKYHLRFLRSLAQAEFTRVSPNVISGCWYTNTLLLSTFILTESYFCLKSNHKYIARKGMRFFALHRKHFMGLRPPVHLSNKIMQQYKIDAIINIRASCKITQFFSSFSHPVWRQRSEGSVMELRSRTRRLFISSLIIVCFHSACFSLETKMCDEGDQLRLMKNEFNGSDSVLGGHYFYCCLGVCLEVFFGVQLILLAFCCAIEMCVDVLLICIKWWTKMRPLVWMLDFRKSIY